MRTLLAAPPPKKHSHTNLANTSGYVRPKQFKEALELKNSRIFNLARVPEKPINATVANRGLNLADRGIDFISRLDSVPETRLPLI